jgi:NhaP-type Na+/H+ or K+/H+ antiporter
MRMKLAAVLATLLVAFSAQAQSISSARLGVNAQTRAPVAQSDSTDPAIVRIANGALIGAGIGAGVGIIVAAFDTHSATVTDHSEDGLAYIAFAAFGAFIGLVVGGIVGYNHR